MPPVANEPKRSPTSLNEITKREISLSFVLEFFIAIRFSCIQGRIKQAGRDRERRGKRESVQFCPSWMQRAPFEPFSVIYGRTRVTRSSVSPPIGHNCLFVDVWKILSVGYSTPIFVVSKNFYSTRDSSLQCHCRGQWVVRMEQGIPMGKLITMWVLINYLHYFVYIISNCTIISFSI